MAISLRKLDEFVTTCRARRTINFEAIAREMELNWHTEVLPALKQNAQYMEAMQNYLQSLRSEIIDKILQCAIDGRPRIGNRPELSYAKAMLAWIDSGSILGEFKEREPTIDDSKIKEHLKAMNLPSDDGDENDFE